MEDATFLTRFATKVYLIHRRDAFRASPIMINRTLANSKIEIIYNTEVTEVTGDVKVKSLKLINNKTKENSELTVDEFPVRFEVRLEWYDTAVDYEMDADRSVRLSLPMARTGGAHWQHP